MQKHASLQVLPVQRLLLTLHISVIYILCLFDAVGMYLTWGVRHVPSQYNESLHIGACIYNVTIVALFALPLLAANLAGRSITFQLRAYAIMSLSLSTVAILFIPKFLTMFSGPFVGAIDGLKLESM